MYIFSNREIATGIWIIIGTIIYLIKIGITSPLTTIFKLAFSRSIIIYVFLSLIYFLTTLYFLNRVFNFDIYLLKDAFIWFIFSGLILTAKSLKTKTAKNILIIHIVNNLKLIIIIEFIISSCVFSLGIELFFIPINLIVGIMIYISESEKINNIVNTFFRKIVFIVDTIFVLSIIKSSFIDHNKLIGISSIKSFLLPLILMLLYFPFTYFWLLSAQYQGLFKKIDHVFSNKKNIVLGKKLKKRIIKYSHLNYNKINDIHSNKYYFWHLINDEKQLKEYIYYNKHKIVKDLED